MCAVLLAISIVGLLVIALVFQFPVTHHISSSISVLAFSFMTTFIIYETFSNKILKVTERRRRMSVFTKDDGWRANITEEQFLLMINMSMEEQYQYCAKYMESWQQLMNTIGTDSNSSGINGSPNRSNNQNSISGHNNNSNAIGNSDKGNASNRIKIVVSPKKPTAEP